MIFYESETMKRIYNENYSQHEKKVRLNVKHEMTIKITNKMFDLNNVTY